jgi:microcystin-dependent protein
MPTACTTAEPLSGVGKDASSGSLPALIQPGVVGASNGKASQSDSKSSRQVIIQSKQNKSTLFTAQLPTASKAISSVPVSVSQQYRTRNWVGTTFGVDDKVGFGADLSWLTGPAKQSPSSGPLQKIDQTVSQLEATLWSSEGPQMLSHHSQSLLRTSA